VTIRGWGAIVGLSVLWGGAYFTAKVAVDEISVVWIVAMRFVLAAAALGVLLRISNEYLPRSADAWRSFVIMGLCNSLLPGFLVTWAQKWLPSGFAAIVVGCTPLFALALDTCVVKAQKFDIKYLVGTLIALGGLALVVGVRLPEAGGPTLLAICACLGAALSYACANVYGRSFSKRRIAPKAVAFGQIAATAIMALPIAIFIDPVTPTWTMPGVSSIAAIIGLALVSTAGGYILFFKILASPAAHNVSFVTLLIPLSATLLGALFLGERLQPVQFGGLLTMILGLCLVDRAQKLAARRATMLEATRPEPGRGPTGA
jgi:drug/metabolite transporter (DMT)-like permease